VGHKTLALSINQSVDWWVWYLV